MKPDGMTLDQWIAVLAGELGLDDLELDTDAMHIVLDLARDAAHQVQRPAAPLTTFLVGVAVGRGQSLGAAAARATALTTASDLEPDPALGESPTEDDPDPTRPAE